MGRGLTEGIVKTCTSSYKAPAVAIKNPMPNEQINLFIFSPACFFITHSIPEELSRTFPLHYGFERLSLIFDSKGLDHTYAR